jgi:hypothetical protein
MSKTLSQPPNITPINSRGKKYRSVFRYTKFELIFETKLREKLTKKVGKRSSALKTQFIMLATNFDQLKLSLLILYFFFLPEGVLCQFEIISLLF